MKNRKFWVFLLIASLLLTTFAGCGNHAASDTGSSQPGQTTASTTDTTAVPDTTAASHATETTEKEDPPDTDWIVTYWSTLYRYDKDGYSCLMLLDLMLSEDGVGNTMTFEWTTWETETGYLTDEENISGKHEEVIPISYTFDGECLSIAYHESDLDRCEEYTVVRSKDETAFTLISADGEGSLAGMMFTPADRVMCASLGEIFDTFDIDCGLFQPDDPQRPDSTEAPTEQAPEEDTSSDTDWILGGWTTVERDDGFSEGKLESSFVTSVTYSFGADGSGSISDCGWFGRPGVAWEVAGMGFVESYFDYTLEGSTLTITHTGNEFEEYPQEERETVVYTVVRNQDGSILWKSEVREDRVFRKVSGDLSVDELLSIFGLESAEAPTGEAPEGNTSSDIGWIAGDWSAVYRNEETVDGKIQTTFVSMVTYSFGADGSGSINECGWVGRPGEAWEVAGMGFVESYFDYTLEGSTLTIIHTGDEFGEYPEEYRTALAYNVVRNQEGSMSWEPDGGGMDVVYRKVSEDLSVDELLSFFGLDYDVPES